MSKKITKKRIILTDFERKLIETYRKHGFSGVQYLLSYTKQQEAYQQ